MNQLMGPKYVPSGEASHLAGRYNLGQPLCEYKETVAGVGCGAVMFLGIGGIALIATFNNSTNGHASTASTGIAIGLGALVLGLIMLVVWISKSGNRLFACSNGFVYKQGGTEKVVLWTNVEAIYQRIVEHHGRFGKYTTYTYNVQQYDGSQLAFNDNMAPMEGLCNYIEGSMAAQLFPKVTAAYEMGRTVQFGKLAVSKQGFFNGKEWLSWNDVEGIRFRNGFISVQKRGKWLNWASFFTPSIPNFTVLELLIEYIERARGW